MFFIVATFIVTMTIYVILSMIIEKYPSFMEKGVWKNPFNTLIIGTFILFVFVTSVFLGSNYINLNSVMSKAITFAMGYPVVFVLIIMIDSFYKGVFHIDRKKRLFFSSITIVIGLEVMVLIGMLGDVN